MGIIEQARSLALTAHEGQVDKAGEPYWRHPERVAAYVEQMPLAGSVRQHAIASAWLHDVLEDTDVSADDLRTMFPAEVVDAVLALTRGEAEDPNAYYARVKGNELALAVKKADLVDNTDPQRTARLPEVTRERLKAKYAHARAVLNV